MSSPQENLYDAIRIVKRKIIPLAFILTFLTIWIVSILGLLHYA